MPPAAANEQRKQSAETGSERIATIVASSSIGGLISAVVSRTYCFHHVACMHIAFLAARNELLGAEAALCQSAAPSHSHHGQLSETRKRLQGVQVPLLLP
jgi:hypothetical protein